MEGPERINVSEAAGSPAASGAVGAGAQRVAVPPMAIEPGCRA